MKAPFLAAKLKLSACSTGFPILSKPAMFFRRHSASLLLVSSQIRQLLEEHEAEWLSPYAARASESSGRIRPEPEDPVRTCFQRDRDRILHSKSFRRLKHKTQVFIDPRGDHFRTRMTHTLEVAQIARTIGRALRLNEDLIEAIALGHDVGHTPFGHAGEAALSKALQDFALDMGPNYIGPRQFRHYEQSLRIVDVLEGLNLTEETRSGIGGHSKGEKDLTDADGEPVGTLEAAVVRVSDRIAYMNHDLDDAIRSSMIDRVPDEFSSMANSHGRRIGVMVEDVIENSLNRPSIRFSAATLQTLNSLKDWLFENVYHRYPEVFPDIRAAQALVRELFLHFTVPGTLPSGYEGVQGAVDYVSGMTDRFAIATFERLRVPRRSLEIEGE